MLTKGGPHMIEYNARFGDPEAQTLLPLLDSSTDLAEVLFACTEHRLNKVHFGCGPQAAVSVVLAMEGYPHQYDTGEDITIHGVPDGKL